MRYVLTGRGQLVILILVAALILAVLTSVGALTAGPGSVSPSLSPSPSPDFPWEASPSPDETSPSPAPEASPSPEASPPPSAEPSDDPTSVVIPSVKPSLPPVAPSASDDTLSFLYDPDEAALNGGVLPLIDDFLENAPENVSVTTPQISEADRIALLTLLAKELRGAALAYIETSEVLEDGVPIPVTLKYVRESSK